MSRQKMMSHYVSVMGTVADYLILITTIKVDSVVSFVYLGGTELNDAFHPPSVAHKHERHRAKINLRVYNAGL